MPQETKIHGAEARKLEGKSFGLKNAQEVAEVIELAFDYRGDVTIETREGRRVEGYLFNREKDVSEPYVQVIAKNQPGQIRMGYAEIVAITFSGEDPAFGKSWEAWSKKNAEQREIEAAKLAAEATARGHL